MFIVLKLHRESLRQMMQQGRVTHSIKIQVLEIIKYLSDYCSWHGDIKELLVFYFSKNYRAWKNQTKSRKTFWSITTSMVVKFRTLNVIWPIGAQRATILAEHQCMQGREHTKDSIKTCFLLHDWPWSSF